MAPAAYLAFTAPINPSGVTPVLNRAQVWKGLERKVRHAEEFVAGAIKHTDVLKESTDSQGREVVLREVIFVEGERRAQEECVLYEDMKVEFVQKDGTRVLNTVSDGADGELYMTYQFEWKYPDGADEAKKQELTQKWKGMSKMAVEKSIVAIREMVKDGRIKA